MSEPTTSIEVIPPPAGGRSDLSREQIEEMLLAPFDPREVKFRPGSTSGSRALALAYVDARVVQDRLDDVLGVCGWQDEYEALPDGSVVCRLRVRLGGEWITKMDVGGPSEQPDEGDRRKAAFSDALKRAAVKFGIGRYLYRLPQIWCDYDPQKKRFVGTPALPGWALPAVKRVEPPPVSKPQPPKQPAREWTSLAIDQSKRLRDSFERQLADAPDLAAVDKIVSGMKASGEHLTDQDARLLFHALSARLRKHSRERLEEAGDTATVQDAVREMLTREKLFTNEDRAALSADVKAAYARVRAEPVAAANGAAREPGVDEE